MDAWYYFLFRIHLISYIIQTIFMKIGGNVKKFAKSMGATLILFYKERLKILYSQCILNFV